jgi:hypothetical protein
MTVPGGGLTMESGAKDNSNSPPPLCAQIRSAGEV